MAYDRSFLQLNKLQKTLYRQLYKKSFYEFVKAFWQEADPAPYDDGKKVQFFCEISQYFAKPWIGYEEINIQIPPVTDNLDVIDIRGDKKNLCVNLPPPSLKDNDIFSIISCMDLD